MLRWLAFFLTFAFALPAAADTKPEAKKGIVGIWQGTLKVGAIELRIAFHITEKDGQLAATMDSIDQGVTGIPVGSVAFKENQLTLGLERLKAGYTGTLQADGDTIKGDFDQGAKIALDLKRVEKVAELKRPQHPKAPYPYDAEDVRFDSKAKDVKLAGTFTKPKGDGPFPTVVLISGSGPQNRDEELMGHKPFLVIADHLTRQGIAVLRYDDRGTFNSTGSHETATSKDFADDAAGAVAWLKARKDVGKVGLMGHSEGGLIAPMVAAESKDVGFIIMLAGPGLPGDEIIADQADLILKASGISAELRAKLRVMSKKFTQLIQEGADLQKLKDAEKEMEKALTADDQKTLKAAGAIQAADSAYTRFMTPWFKFFLAYDPRPTLAKVTCPVLAINGELDLQVPCTANLEAIAKALSHNKDVTTKAYPKLNHLFQTSTTGHPKEYGQIEETFAPAALETIAAWITKRK